MSLAQNVLDILVVIVPSITVAFCSIVSIWAIYNHFKGDSKQLKFKDFTIGNYMILFFRKLGDKYVEMERKRIDITREQKFRYNGKDFSVFDKDKIGFSDKKHNFYCFDYDKGEQLSFSPKEFPEKVSLKDVDDYVNKGIISQLVRGLEEAKTNKSQWIMLIMGLAIGGLTGYMIAMTIHPQITVKIIEVLLC